MNQERGGTLLGFIVGVVVGLGAALAVAVYVTKVPVPFVNRGQTRSAEQDNAEARKNKDWDPNAALSGKGAAKPVAAPDTAAAVAPGAPLAPANAAAAPAAKAVPPKAEVKPAVSADPLGDLAKAKSAAGDADALFTYFVQLGAFKTSEDAESQRAKLSLAGIETKVSEREQSGHMVYRVRVGPFEKLDLANQAKDKLDKSGLQTALVRVQR